ncbi:MAG: phosphoglycerate dehydrogenase [Candidatus Binatia bacterium]
MSESHKVLITDSLAAQGLTVFERYPDVAADYRPGLPPEEIRRAIAPYDALVVRSGTRVTAEIIEAGARLKVIGRAGIGVDNIDVEAATKRGIVVMNTPGGNNVTTAEHTVTLLLALARNIPQASASLRAGKWERGKFTGVEVSNKTLGIVGIGNIGSVVAERAQGLKMKVIACDPYISAEAAARLGIELVTLEDLFTRADFVSVHTPLTPETRGLIGAEELARMKRGVRLVNCARGGIIDEQALADAVRSGHVAGAALDVFTEEPPPKDHPLFGLDAVIATPHLGASTDEAQINVAIAIAEQVADFLRGGEVRAAVNFPNISADRVAVLRPFLILGEKVGSLQAQMVADAPVEVDVEGSGEVAEHDMKALSAAVLKGLLSPVMESVVNFVNAPVIARERGIRVVESYSSLPSDFLNSLTVRVKRSGGATTTVAGAVFGKNTLRIVRINKFYMEAVPKGHILMLNNRDVPGVVGAVGTLLGRHGINIAGIELGRDESGMAISFFHVDEVVPPPVLAELRQLQAITSAQLVRL